MKKKNVLDAFSLIAYLKEEPGHSEVHDLLASKNTDLFINAINLGEVFYIFARNQGLRAAEFVLNAILPSLSITILENSLDDVIAAARLKAAHAVSFADCCAAQSAIRENASLVTGDPEFKKLASIIKIDWIG